MQFPIQIGLRRSFLQLWILWGLGLCATLACLLPAWPWMIRVALLLLLAWGLHRTSLRVNTPVHSLRLTLEGEMWVRFRGRDDSFCPVTLRAGIYVHPWLTVIPLAIDSHDFFLCLTPDCLSRSHFRQLRLWLTWQAGRGSPLSDDVV